MAYVRKLLSNNTNANSSPPPLRPAVVAGPTEAVAIESDFAVILAALLCALISVAGLIAVARCSGLRRGLASGGAGGGGGNRLANKGLKKKVLKSLPKYVYTFENNVVSAVGEECGICLAEYVNGEEIRVLPQCGHRFHVECIDKWFAAHSSCPSCRKILVVVRCRKCGERPMGGLAADGAGDGFVKPSQLSSSDVASTSSPTFGLENP